nr:LuxR C-terminal-related transcriptional regulator [Tessaracoccus sp. OS52]
MEARLDAADAALAAGVKDPSLRSSWADTEDLRRAPATIRLYRAALAQARGNVPATARHAREALAMAEPRDHLTRGSAAGFVGLAAWATGSVEEALTTFTAARSSLRAAGNVVDALDMSVVLGDMWVTAGKPKRAREEYDAALESVSAIGEPHARAVPDLHVALADLEREQGRLAAAEAHLETARAAGVHGSITENRHRWYVVTAQVRAAQGEHAVALQLLDEAEERYRAGSYPDIRPIPAIRARLHIAAGDLDTAREWAREHGVSASRPATFLREYEHLTLVRLLLGQQRHSQGVLRAVATPRALDEVFGLLDRLEADAAPKRAGSLLEIRVLRALALHAAGRMADALAVLGVALALAPDPDGYVRLFLDEGPAMLALLRTADDEPPETDDGNASLTGGVDSGRLRRHAQRLLRAAEGVPAPSAAPTDEASVGLGLVPRPPTPADMPSLPDPLSRRELEILRLLPGDLTGPELARQLFVSLNTLRTHTKRIYTKLDVGTRAAAVRRGRELGLL